MIKECWNCGGEGFSSHDCGDDTCCCADPVPNVRCHICKGQGVIEVPDDCEGLEEADMTGEVVDILNGMEMGSNG